MSEETSNLINESNAAELNTYLAFKKRNFDKGNLTAESSSQPSLSDEEVKRMLIYVLHHNQLTKVSKEVVIYCKNISDALDEAIDSTTIIFELTSEIDKKVKNVCLSFISSPISLNPKSEDGFIDFYLKPLFREVILNSCKKKYGLF
ncbi:hypothetical protein MFLAVUS_002012 [Mucor flavus]|uniref:Uncharacterized protein n=1 Tax=Mucor flavus TaxID=439312 RepID=A0ABP9YP39_9FUNG